MAVAARRRAPGGHRRRDRRGSRERRRRLVARDAARPARPQDAPPSRGRTGRPARSRRTRSTSGTASTSTAAARTPSAAGVVVASSLADGRLWRLDPDGAADAVALTPEGPWRYGDLWLDAARDRLYAVRETHPDEARRVDLVRNELVALALDGSDGAGRVLVSGPDFVAGGRPSPDGSTLAWVEWDHPSMPWDATRLRVAAIRADGTLGEARTIAGGTGPVSVIQPAWSPAGVLHAVSEATGWWNLYAFDGPGGVDGPARNLAPMDAELGEPAWELGAPTYAFLADGAILAVARADGRDTLLRIEPDGAVRRIDAPFTEVYGLNAAGDGAVAVVGGPREPRALVRLSAEGAVDGRARPRPVGADRPRLPARARVDRVRDHGRRHGPRPVLRAGEPAVPGPRRRPAAADRHVPRRADRLRDVRPVARPRVLHLARHRGGRRRLPRVHGLRATVPRRAQGPVGRGRRRRLRRGRPVPRGARGRGPGPARHPGRQLRRLHDARRPRLRAGRVRGRHQPLRDRGPRADPPGRPQVRVALRRGPDRPVDAGGPRGLPRPVADPPPRPDARPDAPVPGHWTTRSCRRPSWT